MEYHTVLFGEGRYRQMADALKRSVERNSPHKLIVHDIRPKRRSGRHKLVINTVKIEKWNEVVQQAEDNIVLLDCDTVLLKDVSHVFEKDFDLAYTKRTEGVRFPLNGGVVFVKPTKESKEFFKEWLDVNNRMMREPHFHRPWHVKYAGINQASFGYLLENDPTIDIIDLPCAKYNACDTVDWRDLEDPYILHIKSDLQNQCFAKEPSRFKEAAKIWKEYAIL